MAGQSRVACAAASEQMHSDAGCLLLSLFSVASHMYPLAFPCSNAGNMAHIRVDLHGQHLDHALKTVEDGLRAFPLTIPGA